MAIISIQDISGRHSVFSQGAPEMSRIAPYGFQSALRRRQGVAIEILCGLCGFA
jgi:hypothetical protein